MPKQNNKQTEPQEIKPKQNRTKNPKKMNIWIQKKPRGIFDIKTRRYKQLLTSSSSKIHSLVLVAVDQ